MSSELIISVLVLSLIGLVGGVIRYLLNRLAKKEEIIAAETEANTRLLGEIVDLLGELVENQVEDE